LTPKNLLNRTHRHDRKIVHLAQYLDSQSGYHWLRGILAYWSRQYVVATRQLLSEVITLTPDVNEVLDHPRRQFEADSEEQVESWVRRYFCSTITLSSPEYIRDTLTAQIHQGLGNFKEAVRRSEWAWCEKWFAERNPRSPQPMNQQHINQLRPRAELHQAQLLVEALSLFRSAQIAADEYHRKHTASQELTPDEPVVLEKPYPVDVVPAATDWEPHIPLFDR
jgi:hypothetical protein